MMNKAEMVRMNLQSIIDDQKSVIDEQRAEIEQLRAELADARRQLQAGWIEVCQTSADLLQKDLADKLAASQAREKVLREALEAVQGIADQSDGVVGWHRNGDVATWASLLPEVPNALVLPADDTALREAIAKAKEEMRGRCAIAGARVMEEMGIKAGGKIFADGQVIADAIRALEVKP